MTCFRFLSGITGFGGSNIVGEHVNNYATRISKHLPTTFGTGSVAFGGRADDPPRLALVRVGCCRTPLDVGRCVRVWTGRMGLVFAPLTAASLNF